MIRWSDVIVGNLIKLMPALSEEDIQSLFMWIDEIPLSRPKKNLTRDFADGVLTAEVVKHFVPKLVDLHNYAPANSISQKIYNWSTLNDKVFRKLGYSISDPIINAIVTCKTGYIEYLLFELRQKIEEYLVHKPAISLNHGRKQKSFRSKQSSERSNKSDQTSESEPEKHSQMLDSQSNHEYIKGYHNDSKNDGIKYQKDFVNGNFMQSGTENAALPITNSPYMAHGGYTNVSPQSGNAPKNQSNVPMISTSQAVENSHAKSRVVIKDPVPYYKTPNPANNIPWPAPTVDYGREIAETLR